MRDLMRKHLQNTLHDIRAAGLYKAERLITSPQNATIDVEGAGRVLNLCANNYLGLADHPAIVAAAKSRVGRMGLRHGVGAVHLRHAGAAQGAGRRAHASFSEREDTILYSSCFDANGGLFETLLGPDDAVISDELNHASIIDGIRLCKAQRLRYATTDMADLEAQLKAAADARFRMIATDGVFSMDGYLAPLAEICDWPTSTTRL